MVRRSAHSKKNKKKIEELTIEHPIIAKKIDKSLEMSIKEGSLASVSDGFGLSYLSPFALAMNATSSQIGILHGIISLLPCLVQLQASKLIEKFSRKKIVLTSVLLKILLWIPIILTGILFYLGVPHMVWILIGLIGMFYMLMAIAHPVWFSWMGSLVPGEGRGKYFSRRNRAAGICGVLTLIVAALILDGAKKIGSSMGNVLGFTLLGFGIIFIFAALAKLWGWKYLARQYEPRLKVRKKDYFSFWQFLKKSPETAFGRFAIFKGIFSIVIGIAGPFWTVYMLRDLGFSYVWFMGITVSAIVFQLMFLPLLGQISDKFGNISLMKLCSTLIFLTPLIWIASSLIKPDLAVKLFLLFVPSITGGFAFAGYNLATNNYIYDAVSTRKRSFGLSYMNLLVGFGTFIGASIGSLIAWIGIPFMNTILFIFLVSGVGRLLVASFGVKYLKEVRHVQKFSSNYIIREFRPMQGVVREIHHLEHLVGKVEHYI